MGPISVAARVLAVLLVSSLLPGAVRASGVDTLKQMIGSWQVEVEMHTPSGSAPGQGEAHVTLGPGGRSLLMDYRNTQGPMPSFALHQIVTWSDDGSEYTLVWVDSRNSGATVVHGSLHDEEFRFDQTRTVEGVETIFRSTYRDVRENSFEARSFVLSGGITRPVLTLKYRRKE